MKRAATLTMVYVNLINAHADAKTIRLARRALRKALRRG